MKQKFILIVNLLDQVDEWEDYGQANHRYMNW
jgi:hypothetical protein